MKLILCSDGDTTAAWTYANLRSLGCADLELVTSGELANATQWSHRVKSNGSTAEIHLQDGRQISLSRVDGVINRLNLPSRALISQATREDQDYAWSESFAFYLSWLHSLPGKVFNRATPQGLCGTWRSAAQWAVLAGQAGFDVAPYCESETGWERSLPEGRTLTRVVVLEGKPFGIPEIEEIEAACQGLFSLTETSLLGVDLYQSEEGHWMFLGATPMPNMCAGGLPLLEAILKTWSEEVIQ
jgi:hypothetical protein